MREVFLYTVSEQIVCVEETDVLLKQYPSIITDDRRQVRNDPSETILKVDTTALPIQAIYMQDRLHYIAIDPRLKTLLELPLRQDLDKALKDLQQLKYSVLSFNAKPWWLKILSCFSKINFPV